jgi:predicted nucleic acid-binding protein
LTIVVDASVALKWFVPEALSENAASLLDGSADLSAPDLLYPEFGNILWKKVQRQEITTEDAREILIGLRRVPLALTPSSILIDAALEIAIAHRRTVYDSLYVALAVARDSILVTADDKLANVLSGGPLTAHIRTLSSYSASGR